MNWYQNKVVAPDGRETVYEMIGGQDNLGFGTAMADIELSIPHYHKRAREIYVLMSGRLEVFIEGRAPRTLEEKGESVEIPLGARHYARSLSVVPARILVITVPPWSAEDHILGAAP